MQVLSDEPLALAAGLYIVATPLGHARDITLRALDVMRAADVLYCEDTRHTGKLAALYEIKTRRVAYHEHNGDKMRPRILARLAAGEAVALVSDAGTPLISDPGLPLVRAARQAGHAVYAIPGASAPIAALSVAGLATHRFAFIGFLPPKRAARQKALAELAELSMTCVLFESPQRLVALLDDLAAQDGEHLGREIVVARELTKAFEEVQTGSAAALAAYFSACKVRGELVVLIGPPLSSKALSQDAAQIDDAMLDAALRAALAKMSLRDAVRAVMASSGEKRKRVYARALVIARDADIDTKISNG